MLVLATVEGEFLAAGGTAPDVWEALEGPRTLAELTASLADTFDAPPQVVGEHVGPFVRELERAGWVRAEPGPA